MNRRDLIKGAVAVIPAAVALDMLGQKYAYAAPGDFKTPLDVLNYALTLEYLEAAFYTQGNGHNLLSGKADRYLKNIQSDEETHVAALQSTIKSLGETPVSAPEVDFGSVFASKNSFLTAAYTFENLGVQAYLGAAPSLFNEKPLLQAAASIFGVEARHAAIIANLQNRTPEGGVYKGPFETPASKSTVLAAAGPFIVSAQTL